MMITPDKAWNIIAESLQPLKTINKPLDESLGHYLATSIQAQHDMPAVDRSAMDGYAVRASDLKNIPAHLELCGEISAGSDASPSIKPGQCTAIFTGANVPPDADTVVMIEDTESTSDSVVTFLKPVQKGQNIFKRGENAMKGDTVIRDGELVSSSVIAACASCGYAELKIYSKPSVAIITTGNEIVPVGTPIETHQIYDSNGPMLTAALNSASYTDNVRLRIEDNPHSIVDGIKSALTEYDVVIITGGVSVGKYDFASEAIVKAGAAVHFHGVAMKPGKPQLFATAPDNKAVFGLPGNPLSVMTGFYRFVLPALKLLSGAPIDNCCSCIKLPLNRDVNSKGKREAYVISKLVKDKSGISVEPIDNRGSADIIAGGGADGSIIVPVGTKQISSGTTVDFMPWDTKL